MAKSITLKNIFKSIDKFGFQPKFRINNNKNFTSLGGGIATLTYFLFAIFFVLGSFVTFLKRQKLSFIYSNKLVPNQPYVNLTETGFSLAFSVLSTRSFENVMEDVKEYLDFTININTWVGLDSYNTEIPTHYCLNEDFPLVSPEDFEESNLVSFICPNTTIANMTITGINTDYNYQAIDLIIRIKESVKDLTKFKNFTKFQPIMGVLAYINKGIIYDNTTNPVQYSLDFFLSTMDLEWVKMTEVLISNLIFSSDENWFFSDPSVKLDASLDNFKDVDFMAGDRSPGTGYDKDLLTFSLRANPKYYILSRTFQKIPEFLANLSGLLSQILLVLFISFSFINEKGAEQKLMNKSLKSNDAKNYKMDYLIELFSKVEKPKLNPKESDINNISLDVNEENKIDRFIHPKQSCHVNFPNFIPNIDNGISENINDISNPILLRKGVISMNPSHINFEENKNDNSDRVLIKLNNTTKISNNFFNQLKKKINNNPNPLKIVEQIKVEKVLKRNMFGILFSQICCCSNTWKQKNQILQEGEKKIYYYMDILTYVRKLQEIDILKFILLSQDQMRIFKFISKPHLSSKNTASKLHKEYMEDHSQNLKLSEEEVEKIIQSYKNLLNQNIINDQDKKIIELFEEELNCIETKPNLEEK